MEYRSPECRCGTEEEKEGDGQEGPGIRSRYRPWQELSVMAPLPKPDDPSGITGCLVVDREN